MAVTGLKAPKHTGPRKARSYAVQPAGTRLGNRGTSGEQRSRNAEGLTPASMEQIFHPQWHVPRGGQAKYRRQEILHRCPQAGACRPTQVLRVFLHPRRGAWMHDGGGWTGQGALGGVGWNTDTLPGRPIPKGPLKKRPSPRSCPGRWRPRGLHLSRRGTPMPAHSPQPFWGTLGERGARGMARDPPTAVTPPRPPPGPKPG